jgi:Fe-S-cluster containining protein
MFPCSGCGLCCQNISNVQELKSYDLGNGVCKYFDKASNGCNIYDTRPDICRVDTMFELVYHKEFGLEEFYIANASVCNALQESYKIDTSFRITIGEK